MQSVAVLLLFPSPVALSRVDGASSWFTVAAAGGGRATDGAGAFGCTVPACGRVGGGLIGRCRLGFGAGFDVVAAGGPALGWCLVTRGVGCPPAAGRRTGVEAPIGSPISGRGRTAGCGCCSTAGAVDLIPSSASRNVTPDFAETTSALLISLYFEQPL